MKNESAQIKFLYILACTILLSCIQINAQEDTVIVVQKNKYTLKKSTIKQEFNRIRQLDDEGVALFKHLSKNNFKELKKNANYYGQSEVFKDRRGRELKSKLYVQDFKGDNTNDKAALVQTIITLGPRSEVYTCILIAKNGDFNNVEELMVDEQNNVVKANSWWSCVKKRLLNCAGPCVVALASCSGTWAAYLGCVAVACGGCYVGIAACCSCNCKWYCKWGVGCCRK